MIKSPPLRAQVRWPEQRLELSAQPDQSCIRIQPTISFPFFASEQGNRILNSSDRQGLVDRTSGTGETGRTVGTNRTDRTNRTNRISKTRTSKTCQADWIHLTNNPTGPIGPISPIGPIRPIAPIFHPLLARRIQNAIALASETFFRQGDFCTCVH
jgi:hypothetical protein